MKAYFMFHEMPLKLYFMTCSERNVSQCILVLIIIIIIDKKTISVIIIVNMIVLIIAYCIVSDSVKEKRY